MNDGETAVIGGLTVTSVTKNRSGIPLLVNLPIIGKLFGFSNDSGRAAGSDYPSDAADHRRRGRVDPASVLALGASPTAGRARLLWGV